MAEVEEVEEEVEITVETALSSVQIIVDLWKNVMLVLVMDNLVFLVEPTVSCEVVEEEVEDLPLSQVVNSREFGPIHVAIQCHFLNIQ